MARSAKTRNSRQNKRTGTRDSSILDSLLGLAGPLLRGQQVRMGEQIGNLAEAAKTFASDLRDAPEIQEYAKSAVKGLTELSEYVADTDVQVMARDAKKFAQRYPLALAASTVVVGYFAWRGIAPFTGKGRSAPTKAASRASGRSQNRATKELNGNDAGKATGASAN